MSLLASNTYASPGQPLYGGVNAGLQTLSQTGNTVSLSPSGGSVDIAATTLVADTAQKTTAITYDTGFLATTVNGELLIHGRTEVGEPLNPANLSVTGTLELGGAISDNSTATGSAGQFLSAGAGGEVIWATIPGGSGIAAVNAGTNISIPDPGIPVVSIAITTDLDMANHSITSLNSINAYAFSQLGINAPGSVSIQTPQLIIPSLATYDANFLTADPFGIITTAPVPASTWVGTATSDLNMNGYNITTPSNLTIGTPSNLTIATDATVTITAEGNSGFILIRSEGVGGGNGVAIQTVSAPITLSSNNEINVSADGNVAIESSAIVSVSNPTVGNGGAQLNINGSASIRSDTAQLQILDNAGVQKGVLSYNVIDGQTHLDGTDLAISSSSDIDVTANDGAIDIRTSGSGSIGLTAYESVNITAQNTDVGITGANAVSITATNGDLSLTATAGNVTITAQESNINLDSHTDIGISSNNNGTINIGGATTSTVNIQVVDNVGMSSSGGGTLTANFEVVSIDAVGSTLNLHSYQDMTISSSTANVGITAFGSLGLNGDTVNIGGGYLNANMGGGINLTSSGALNVTMDDPITISTTGNTDPISITSAAELTLSAAYDLTMTSGTSASLTTTGGGIELHSNGGNLVLASAGDGVSISSGGGDNVTITGGGGGLNCSTTSGGAIGLTSDGNMGLTSVDNMTVTGGGDLTISTTNVGAIAQFSTNNISITLDEASQSIVMTAGSGISLTAGGSLNIGTTTDASFDVGGDFIVENGGVEHLRVSSSNVTITDAPLAFNGQNITGVNNVLYQHSYSTTGVTLNSNSPAIQTFNGTGLTATLPLVSVTNVGRQFIITNVAVVGLTVASSGSQLIYYNVGSSSSTSRTLGPGHSQILTAIRSGVSTYGWSMV